MATIAISDLPRLWSVSDSESYMSNLSEEELGVIGGLRLQSQLLPQPAAVFGQWVYLLLLL